VHVVITKPLFQPAHRTNVIKSVPNHALWMLKWYMVTWF